MSFRLSTQPVIVDRSGIHVSIAPLYPPAADPISPVTHEIADIKKLLDSSSVSASFMGKRCLVGSYGSVEIDSVAERLKIVSKKEISSRTDSANGIYCVKKLREFYVESDVQANSSILAKICNVFAKAISVLCLPIIIPYKIAQHLFWPKSVEHSIRACIEEEPSFTSYSIGSSTPSIEKSFLITTPPFIFRSLAT